MKVEITDVRAAVVESPFKWVLVQVRTNVGLMGIGEAWYGPGVLDAVASISSVVHGEDPRDVSMLCSRLAVGKQAPDEQGGVEMAWTAIVERFGLTGAWVCDGPTMYAISGFEIALCDLKGKLLETPVYHLLGGKFRSEVRLYADLHGDPTQEPEVAWPSTALNAVEAGYDAVKFDIDLAFPEEHRDPWNRRLSNREVERTLAAATAIRAAVGDNVDLALDCHWQFNVVDALRLARGLEPLDLMWLEDPIPQGNVQALAQVAGATSTPIAIGEVLWSTERFRPFLEAGACDVVHPDVCSAGGVLATKRIGDLADDFYAPLALHNSGGPVSTFASAHVAAASKTFIALEFHNFDVPWWLDIVRLEGVTFQHGCVTLSDQAVGLGLELDEIGCRHHVVDWEVLFV